MAMAVPGREHQVRGGRESTSPPAFLPCWGALGLWCHLRRVAPAFHVGLARTETALSDWGPPEGPEVTAAAVSRERPMPLGFQQGTHAPGNVGRGCGCPFLVLPMVSLSSGFTGWTACTGSAVKEFACFEMEFWKSFDLE